MKRIGYIFISGDNSYTADSVLENGINERVSTEWSENVGPILAAGFKGTDLVAIRRPISVVDSLLSAVCFGKLMSEFCDSIEVVDETFEEAGSAIASFLKEEGVKVSLKVRGEKR